MSEPNPGEVLRGFLVNIYPLKEHTFVHEMDDDFMSDGELVKTFYYSCINYLVRRLITTAEHYRRRFPPDLHGSNRYKSELKKFLKDYTRYNDRQLDKLVTLLHECLAASDRLPSPTTISKKRARASEQNHYCYICGREVNYQHSGEHNNATIDHIWPRAMGGLSDNDNLQVACEACNSRYKKDYIDAADFHFEEISLISTSYEEYSGKEKNRAYEVAVFARTNYKCAVCGQPAYRLGELKIGRIEPNDSWHFLNLQAYCSEHAPE